MLCRMLLQHGALGDLVACLPSYTREAIDRGDLYTLINLRTTHAIVALATGSAADASAHLDECDRHLTREGFHVQHYLTLVARAQVSIHHRQPEAAYRSIAEAWPKLKRSMLLRVPLIRIHSHDTLGRAALAIAAADKARQPELRPVVARCIKALAAERDPWVAVLRDTLAGCASLIDGERENGVAHLRRALAAAKTHAMNMHAAALSGALGQLLADDEGATLIASAEAWSGSQGVSDLKKSVAFLVPRA